MLCKSAKKPRSEAGGCSSGMSDVFNNGEFSNRVLASFEGLESMEVPESRRSRLDRSGVAEEESQQ